MRITICGIPELGEHCAAGGSHVLSILDPGWPDPVAFLEFPPHRREALRFHDVIEPVSPITVLPSAEHVARLRPRAWPNLLLLEHGEAALGREGEFTAAVAEQYRLVAAADPSFALFI